MVASFSGEKKLEVILGNNKAFLLRCLQQTVVVVNCRFVDMDHCALSGAIRTGLPLDGEPFA
ncbi:hypothetical protein, partial [Pseudomonas aeruginosa]